MKRFNAAPVVVFILLLGVPITLMSHGHSAQQPATPQVQVMQPRSSSNPDLFNQDMAQMQAEHEDQMAIINNLPDGR
jgi:hypothetical protein